VQLLLERGADADQPDVRGNLPLHGAADSGHEDVVRLLLARTRDPAAKNRDGKSARDLARERGYEEIERLLP
jgi:ankyrin repeat protein